MLDLRTCVVWIVAVMVVVTVAGCGSGDSSTLTSSTGTSSSFCEAFRALSASGGGSSLNLTSKAAWDQRLAVTRELVDLAPPAQQANATIYLQLVTARVQLASLYNYVSVPQLPADVRNQFIVAHQSQQGQSNIFIAYAKTTCNIE
jgi:hypothetical protein